MRLVIRRVIRQFQRRICLAPPREARRMETCNRLRTGSAPSQGQSRQGVPATISSGRTCHVGSQTFCRPHRPVLHAQGSNTLPAHRVQGARAGRRDAAGNFSCPNTRPTIAIAMTIKGPKREDRIIRKRRTQLGVLVVHPRRRFFGQGPPARHESLRVFSLNIELSAVSGAGPRQFARRKIGGRGWFRSIGPTHDFKGTTRRVAGSIAFTNATMAFFEKVE